MSLRPSKRYFYARLRADLAAFRSGTGLDAAAANMKNYPFFKTDRYIGVDISRERLEAGQQRYHRAVALLADLTAMKLPENSIDVCVSTHTFEHLPPERQMIMLDNLVTATRKDGAFLCNKRLDKMCPPIEAYLRRHFSCVRKLTYRNRLSVCFEEKYLKVQRGPILHALDSALFRIESLTRWFPVWNASAYFVCRDKHTEARNNILDMSQFTLIHGNFYSVG